MDEFTIRDYLKVLFRQKWVIIVTLITVMITVTIGLMLKTPIYEAQVKILISGQKQLESPYYTELFSYQNIQAALTQAEIVKSNPVIERVVRALVLWQKPLDYESQFASPLKKILITLNVKMTNAKLEPLTPEQKQAFIFRTAVEELKNNLKIEPIRDTNIFTIKATDFNPLGAAIVANVASRSYIIFDLEQQLAEMQIKYGEKHLAVTQLKDNIEKLTNSLGGEPLPVIEAIGPASVKIIEQAQIPLKPAGISNFLIFILAFFMSIFLGVMLAFGFEYLDQTFKSPQDIEKTLNIPFLGFVPKKAHPENYQNLADQIYFAMKDRNLKSLLITSVLPKEGVSTTIAGIAKCLSNKGKCKVIVIDANLRNPSLHNIFKVSNGVGLVDVLEGKTVFEKAILELGENLTVLPAGKADLNPITLLESHRMIELINVAKQKYGIVLIDCVDLKEVKDAIDVASYAEAVALVVNEGKTRRQVAKSAIVPLEQKKANLIGAILNNRTFAIPKMIYDRI